MMDNTLFRHADVNQFVLVSNEDLGAVEVATFIALVLFGISLSQGYSYYHRWSEDSKRMKFLVSRVFLSSLIIIEQCFGIQVGTIL
jgi:hypothetical protein